MKHSYSLLRDESGSITILLVVMIPIFLLMMALITDICRVWVVLGEMQKALDAAALSGASAIVVQVEVDGYGHVYSSQVTTDALEAESLAIEAFNQNSIGNVTITALDVIVNGSKVTVSAEGVVQSMLLKIVLGTNSLHVTRQASADALVTPP